MHYGIENGNYRDINASNIECGNYVINQCLKFSNTKYKTIVLSQDNLISTPDKIVGNTNVCAGKSEVYTVPAISKASSYNWTLPNGATGTSTTNSITINFGASAVSGNISVKGINGCGIGAPFSLGVIVNQLPIKPTIIQNGDVLHSSVSIGNQWYDKNGLIAGSTNQDYTPKTSGDYYVIVSNNGCSSAASNTVHLIPTTVHPRSLSNAIKVYPNPVTNELIIDIIENNNKTEYEIINRVGQLVTSGQLQDKAVIQTSHLTPGTYLIKLKSVEVLEFRKIVKK
ncbi:MAG: T9SS type A sorting domain-containing protein [Acetobacterium sp.]|nr:T9SS type A sorting domain-containing protein [Acetobacterium sp.]